MNDGPRYANFQDYVRVVRERRVLIVLVTLLFAGAAAAYSVRQPEIFRTETALYFEDLNEDLGVVGTQLTPSETAEQRAALAAAAITTPPVIERARRAARPRTLAGAVTARPEARTNLVIVSAEARSPNAAARTANAYARAARDVAIQRVRDRFRAGAEAARRQRVELGTSRAQRDQRIFLQAQEVRLRQIAELVSPVRITREAAAPTAPISPKPVRNTALGIVLGLTLGLLLAFMRDALDRRFRTSREISDELHLPIVGHVREEVLGRAVSAVDGRPPLTGPELEGFRILRTNVEFLDVDRPPRMVLVTSALPEEGKSTVAAALASACALAGRRTMLVECDLRRPTQAARLGLASSPGLTDFLVGNAGPADVMQTVPIPRAAGADGAPGVETVPLVCIVAGTLSPQPAELLRSERCRVFFDQVSEVYDTVVIDTSPLLSVVDTLELLPRADAVLVCVRASQTTRDQARAAKQALEHFPARPTGIVITGMRARDEAQNYGYYSYAYAYGDR